MAARHKMVSVEGEGPAGAPYQEKQLVISVPDGICDRTNAIKFLLHRLNQMRH